MGIAYMKIIHLMLPHIQHITNISSANIQIPIMDIHVIIAWGSSPMCVIKLFFSLGSCAVMR